MSLAIQANQAPEKFDVGTAQFEDIFSAKDDRVVISKQTSSNKMSKGSESETHSNKEENKTSSKKGSRDYYSTEEESYDDDFESDPEDSPRKSMGKNTARKSPSPKRNLSRDNTRSPETIRTKSPSIISPRSNKKGKRKRRFKPYESRSSSPATSRLPPEKNWGKPKNRSANAKANRIDHTVVDRVLSANRHKVTKLESRLSQLIQELTKEREENRTLKLIQHRQEKKLEKVIGEEAELPQLLVKHTAEVKSLRERIRKLQDNSYHKDEKINDQDKTILKLKDKCKYYRELCEKEELTEKAELEKNLTKAETNLKKRDEEISKLQRMLNLKEKTHSRNLKEHKTKLRDAQERLRLMEENCNNLQGKLRVREKQLDYTNIYQRQIVLKEKPPKSPDSPPKMAALPAPKRTKPKGKNNTNASKTKGNVKGNDGGFKKEDTVLSSKDSDNETNKKPNSVFLTAQSDKESESDRDINKNRPGNNNKELVPITEGNQNNIDSNNKNMFNGSYGDEVDNNDRRKKDDFEKSLREEDERLKKQKEEVERKLKEIQEREEQEKAEREAKWREDSARRAKEAEERRLESAKRRKEERRKEEERIAEERRQEERKWEERRREEERREQEKKAFQKDDSFFEDEESRRKKDALLARLKAIDSDKASDEDPLKFENKNPSKDDDFWKPQASKSYEARKADQNLHNGLPALPRESRVFSPPKESKVISPPESVKSDPDGVFGVPRNKPVLIGRGGLTKKKDNQFSWLDNNKGPANKNKPKPDDGFNFGDYSPSMNDTKKSNMFDGNSRRAGHGRRRDGGLGESGFEFGEKRGSGGNENTKPQNNSLGFLSDDFGSKKVGEQSSGNTGNNSPLLPRRRAAQERNGPTAISSAFDDTLDDIEEFTL